MVDFPYPDTNMTNITSKIVRTTMISYERVLGEFALVFVFLIIGWGLYKHYNHNKTVLAVYFIALFTIFGPILHVWIFSFIMIVAGIIVTLMIIKAFLERS